MKKDLRKNIIYATSNYWHTTYPVGSHGYAREFLRQGWHVAFLSTPITPWHRFFSHDKELYYQREKNHKYGGVWQEDGHLLDYVPWSLLPSKKFPGKWVSFDCGRLACVLKRNGFCDPRVVWIDTAEYGALFSRFPDALKIFRIVDRVQFFRGSTTTLMDYQMEVAKQADLVIATSFSLESDLNEAGLNNVLRVPNGVELDRFQFQEPPERPQEYKAIKTPIALYVGAIEEWFDLPLLARTAKLLPDVTFVVIGDVRIDISIAEDVSNLLFLGRRNPMLVDSYMYHADVGLIPFRHSELVDAINPVKYYEYVACGLPVVATDSYELRSFGEPILLATGEKDFAEKIQQGLHMDKPEKEELQNRVRNCSWTKRWDLIRESLKERGKTL